MTDPFEQQPFEGAEFVDNPEPRCPCLRLLDVSGSMRGQPIRELNDGLTLFREELYADTLAAKRVEVGIVTFGPVQALGGFPLQAYERGRQANRIWTSLPRPLKKACIGVT